MSVRQIIIGGHRIGLVDLDETFEQVRRLGIEDEQELKNTLLERVKARNYVPPKMEPAYQEDLLDEYRVFIGERTERTRSQGVVEVRVYGPGCPRCQELDRMAMEIIAARGLTIDYQYVTDQREIASQGIIGTPALTVNRKILITGRVPSRRELEKQLLRALDREGRAPGDSSTGHNKDSR